MISGDGLLTVLALLAALVSLLISSYCVFSGLSRSAFSALYWLSLIAVFSGPVCLDLLFGLPQQAFFGSIGYYTPYASLGLIPATYFAFGHILVTALTYFLIMKRHGYRDQTRPMISSRQVPWLVASPHALVVFGTVFVGSSAIAIYQRFDLTRAFNDFLDPTVGPAYETYFYLASTPLIAILIARGKQYRKHAVVVSGISVIVAYFLGVRYYMFPYLGYVVWMAVIDQEKPLGVKLRGMLFIGVIAWIALTMWGVIRGLNLRDNPLALINDPSLFLSRYGYSLTEQLLLGNEFTTRIGYYDLVARLQVLQVFRGFDSLVATVASAVYPFILRILNVPLPLSNAKLIYEIQSGIQGTGISSGSTVFGSDWFTWGWWGIPIGGVIMGTLLALSDRLYSRRGTWWILIGPMWTFQLIFFARGGTDVWLGIWGRFLPISLMLVIAAKALDNWYRRATTSAPDWSVSEEPNARFYYGEVSAPILEERRP